MTGEIRRRDFEFPSVFSASRTNGNVKLKFDKNNNISSRIYKGSDPRKTFTVRPLRSLFTKHLKINVDINGVSTPILVKMSSLKKGLGVSEQQLKTLIAESDGTLNSVAKLHQMDRVEKIIQQQSKLALGQIARELDRSHITQRTKTGKLKVYKNLSEGLGSGSFKSVTLYAKVSGSTIKKKAYAEVKPSSDLHSYRKRIKEAKQEYRIGRQLHTAYKAAYPGEDVPFLKYHLAIHKESGKEESFGMMIEHCDVTMKEASLKDPEQKGEIFLGLLKGAVFMHGQGIVHRDFKPENVMLQEVRNNKGVLIGYKPKIIDFGLSKQINEVDPKRYGGTREYSPPETFVPSRYQGDPTQFDSWSLGIMLHKMHYGNRPFDAIISKYREGKATGEEVAAVMDNFHLEHNDELPIETAIANLLHPDPSERWNVQQALLYLEQVKADTGALLIGE